MNKKEREFIRRKRVDSEYYRNIYLRRCKKKITVLLAPNGCGKSMSLKSIKRECREKEINVISFVTSKDDILHASRELSIEQLYSAFSSEGERIVSSFYKWAEEKLVNLKLTNKKTLYILLDEIDSGLSYDRLLELVSQIIYFINVEDEKGIDVKVVLSCNSYEYADIINILMKDKVTFIWLPSGSDVTLGSYKKFRRRYLDYYLEIVKEDKEKDNE